MSDGSTARMVNDIQHKSLSSLEALAGAMQGQPANVQAAFMNARGIVEASARGRQGRPRPSRGTGITQPLPRGAINNYYFNTRPWNPYAHFYPAPMYPRLQDPYFSLPVRGGGAVARRKRGRKTSRKTKRGGRRRRKTS